MARKLRVNKSLSLADIGFRKFVSFFAMRTLTNNNECLNWSGVVQWYRKNTSLPSANSWNDMKMFHVFHFRDKCLTPKIVQFFSYIFSISLRESITEDNFSGIKQFRLRDQVILWLIPNILWDNFWDIFPLGITCDRKLWSKGISNCL